MSSSRVWFVTGASSGIGLSMAVHALQKGDRVVATLRKPEVIQHLTKEYSTDQLLVLPLDVTQIEDIHAAFRKAKEVFGRVDAVFNNAGFLVIGELESTTLESTKRQFDVNFWGATNVARESVRFMRDENRPSGGLILNVPSRNGIIATPITGYYSATKAALNSALESLSLELPDEWNMKLTLIELGAFRTDVLKPESVTITPPHPSYTSPGSQVSSIRAYIASNPVALGNSDKAVAQLYKLATEVKEPPLHFPLGKDAVEDARIRGKMYLDVAEKWGQWSDDVAFAEDL